MTYNKRVIISCSLAFLLFYVLLVIRKEYIDSTREDDSSYSYTQNCRDLVPFGQCDVVDQYVYFTYRMNKTLVVVYDLNANYLQTIEFPDSQNGAVYIRNDQNHLVLKLRKDSVFLISEGKITTALTEREADQLGYTNDWFRSAKSAAEVTDEAVYVYSEGKRVCVFQLSKEKEILKQIMKAVVWLGAILLAGILKRYKRQSKIDS